MKKTMRMLVLSVVASLTLVFSYGVANACADYIQGSTGSGYECELTGEDACWCYYSCTCSVSMEQCIKNLEADGFIIM